jgi:hypothetical protein
MGKREGKTRYALVRWDEDWARIGNGDRTTIEPKEHIEHLMESWDITVLCDDQPLPILRKMKGLTDE